MILFFSSPSPLFSLFRPSDNPWIAISTLPDLHLSKKKKLKMGDNSLLTKDTWPIVWACALEVDRRMPGNSGSGTCHTAPVDVDSRLFCTCCTCRGKRDKTFRLCYNFLFLFKQVIYSSQRKTLFVR